MKQLSEDMRDEWEVSAKRRYHVTDMVMLPLSQVFS